MNTLLRATALVMGVLTALAAVGVYLFDVLPSTAPDNANVVLALVGLVGVWIVAAALSGDDQ